MTHTAMSACTLVACQNHVVPPIRLNGELEVPMGNHKIRPDRHLPFLAGGGQLAAYRLFQTATALQRRPPHPDLIDQA